MFLNHSIPPLNFYYCIKRKGKVKDEPKSTQKLLLNRKEELKTIFRTKKIAVAKELSYNRLNLKKVREFYEILFL